MDGDPHVGGYLEKPLPSNRVIGIDPGRLLDPPLIPVRGHFQLNGSFPSRGNGLVEFGRDAPSVGVDVLDVKDLVPLVIYLERMLDDNPFPDLPGIVGPCVESEPGTPRRRDGGQQHQQGHKKQ